MPLRFVVPIVALAVPAMAQTVPQSVPPDVPPLAVAVVAELNAVRVDPHGFAARLRAYRARIGSDGIVHLADRRSIRLSEGTAAVDEAITVLDAQPPLRPLALDPFLAAAASDFAAEQARTGDVGHAARDGTSFGARIARHGRWTSAIAETISYGFDDAALVAIQLIVDDGVATRGHRRTILDPGLAVAGAGCAPHPRWGTACVIDYSGAPLRPPG